MNKLLQKISFGGVKFSPEVKKGRSSIDLKDPAKYLDGILRTSTKGIKHFSYVGYRYMGPFEEFDSLLRQQNGKPKQGKVELDVSNTSIRKVIFEFMYDGKPIYKPLYLLALNKEGTFHISDTEWYIMPVLSDRIISFFAGALFFKPFNTKLNVRDFSHPIIINGIATEELILHVDKFYTLRKMTNSKFGTPSTPFLMFVLARYGVHGMLKKFESKATFIITSDSKVIMAHNNDKRYDIYSSANAKIRRFRNKSTESHDKVVIVNRDANDFIKILATSVLYAFDIFPPLANEYVSDRSNLEDILFWKNLVGKIEFKNSLASTGYVSTMNEFENTLGRYIDSISRDECYSMGYSIDDFWDFIYYSGVIFKSMKSNAISNKFDITEKHLEVRYYVLYKIIEGFNKAFANIIKQERSDSVSYESVNKIINGDKIKPMTILKIVQSRDKILSSLLVTSTIANRYFKVTSMMDVQERGNGVKKTGKNSNNAFPQSIRKLRGAHLFVGTITGLSKDTPSPLLRLNLFIRFGANGEVILSDKYKWYAGVIDAALNNIRKDDKTANLVREFVTTDERVGD